MFARVSRRVKQIVEVGVMHDARLLEKMCEADQRLQLPNCVLDITVLQ